MKSRFPTVQARGMGLLRVGPHGEENANCTETARRPWDNEDKQADGSAESTTRFASLRVEHFVEAGIAGRAAMFENAGATASMRVADIANKFESLSAQEDPRSDSVVRPWSKPVLRESNEDNSQAKPIIEPTIKTQLGRRSVKPPLLNPKPPPLAGLPIPNTKKVDKCARENPSSRSSSPSERSDFTSPYRNGAGLPSPMKSAASLMRTPTGASPAPALQGGVVASPLPKRGSRCSMRAPPLSANSRRVSRRSNRTSARQSVRVSGTGQVPRDIFEVPNSGYLGFDENARNSMPSPLTGAPTSIADNVGTVYGRPEYLDYSDPDTLDTFGSLSDEDDYEDGGALTELQTPERAVGALPSLSHSGSEKAIYPEMSYDIDTVTAGSRHDEDDADVLDVPSELISSTEGGKALRELQCASVTAGNELAEQVREYAARSEIQAQASSDEAVSEAGYRRDKISRAQGELELRGRFLRRWNTRYASIVDHAYFGAVLFLFRHDSKASRQGTIALKNSKMIVLSDSTVRELEGIRKNGPPSVFELRTAQRKYVFACLDDTSRQYWMDQLTSFSNS